ncbi:hypothetical protein E3N88_31662 [Mikania micrantha]|uniref:Uncharacterized protein n=1 Tax=Mikania micrantha TaxID=192012 RepID=A0A5N6M709_9ASTR|nr:hypothetical protein E3N88_31662 [Mikania micrantha]
MSGNDHGSEVGDGSSGLFWLDTWVGDMPLADSFPMLYGLEMKKACRVSERMGFHNHSYVTNWNWISQPGTYEEMMEFEMFNDVLRPIPLSQVQD